MESLPSSMATPIKDKNKLDESDDDMFTVPEMEVTAKIHDFFSRDDGENKSDLQGSATSGTSKTNESGSCGGGDANMIQHKKRRGRNPIDKEYRRLKRLLRNRVSAQQARERKKVYVNELETRERELQEKNARLEEKLSTLVNENTMLRKILKNTRVKLDECGHSKA